MEMSKCFVFATLHAILVLPVMVYTQGQSGFISIDCGISDGSSYKDQISGINYVPDSAFIETGMNKNISVEYMNRNLEQQFWNVRSFPEGTRNCYTLKPAQGKDSNYLIRARFMYANYDGKDQLPEFDLYIGGNRWESVKLGNISTITTLEIIHVLTSNYIDVCLVNIGLGTPFISALELRLLNNNTYKTETGSLELYSRLYCGLESGQTVRYGDDIYDRIWLPFNSIYWKKLSTLLTIDSQEHNYFQLPSVVMRTAVTPVHDSDNLGFYWESSNSSSQFYIYLHFAEIRELQANQSREFNIYLNGDLWYGPLTPVYLYTTTVYSTMAVKGTKVEVWINKTGNSTLPPLINAIEIYMVKHFLQSETSQGDVDAIMNIKLIYGIKRNWEGDPCAPLQADIWEGLNCSYDQHDPSRIISLNLSSSGLRGQIAPSLSNLTMLKYLDLSNNSLTGPMPGFLSQLSFLKILNVQGNKLSGSIPEELIERSQNGSLLLRVDKNPSESKKKLIVAVVASVGGAVILFLAAAAVLWSVKRRKQVGSRGNADGDFNKREGASDPKRKQFTYSEVLSITNNFEKAVGKGGFATVYHGHLCNTQVAVKMLSPSSVQGYKQFDAEAELLTRVDHGNLTCLVGYCNEGTNLGLIYEYMANGNLQWHLSDRNANFLSWERRLQIAVDSAQGLEYLHSGCKPPIIHRDVKSTNILLDENFQAKLSDFGMSRVFPVEGSSSHESALTVGTPGYLDPEYYASNRLNEKSDVFSFGVVLLEIITSQPAILKNHEKIHVIQWVGSMLEEGDLRNIVDPRLQGDFDSNSVWKAVAAAMNCVSLSSSERPTVTMVVAQLKECLEMETNRTRKRQDIESRESIEVIPINQNAGLSSLERW